MTELKPHRHASAFVMPAMSANPYSQAYFETMVRAETAPLTRPALLGGHEFRRVFVPKSVEELLFDALAHGVGEARSVLMHFERGWHDRFIVQMRNLLSAEDWSSDDTPPTAGSFATLLRLLLLLRGARRPGLGIANDGHLVATWSAGPRDRLTIECCPRDRVHWIVTHLVDGETESAAGETTLERLPVLLQPYNPERWFSHERPKSP